MIDTKSNFSLRHFVISSPALEQPVPLTMNHVLYLKYTEDIRSASIRLEAQITDSDAGIVSTLQGMEPVFIGWEDTEEPTTNFYQINGVIYDIQDRSTKDGKSKATLLICTYDLINNAATKLSRRFGKGGGKKIHEIVQKEVLKDILHTTYNINIEKTQNKFSFISPYWSPYTIIKWLCAKSIPEKKSSGKNASAGYCFFQNKRGYNFLSYDSFSRAKPIKKLVVGHEPKDNEEPEEDKGIIPIDKIEVTTSFDVLKGLNVGSFNSMVMTLDVKDMKYVEHPFNITKYYQEVPLMNPNFVAPEFYKKFDRDNAHTRIMSKITDTALFTEGTYTKGMTKQLSQASLREKLFYTKAAEVEYIGTNELTVGDVVEVMTFKGKDKQMDYENSGKYVIGRVEKQFLSQDDKMSTKLVLYTDSPGGFPQYMEDTTQ
mgnify:FL=1|tara:strand:- start:1457 stop:2746 length:1290 start_codon:yes stop_codon:yes gene_type:complete